MIERPLNELTLREMFTDVERLTRELVEHLEQGFLPKSQALLRIVPEGSEQDDIADVTVRSHAARLLESGDFAEQLYEKVSGYCAAIDREVTRITCGV